MAANRVNLTRVTRSAGRSCCTIVHFRFACPSYILLRLWVVHVLSNHVFNVADLQIGDHCRIKCRPCHARMLCWMVGWRADTTREVLLVRMIGSSVKLVPRLSRTGWRYGGWQVFLNPTFEARVKGCWNVSQLGDFKISQRVIVRLGFVLWVPLTSL